MPETGITSTVDNDSLRESIHAKEEGRRGGGGERLRVKLEPLTRWSFSFAVLIHPNICGAAAAFAQLAVVFLDVGAAPLSDLACHPRTFEGEGEDMCLRRWTRRNLRLQDQKEKQSFRARAERAHLPPARGARAGAAHLRSDDGSSGDKSLGSCRRLLPSLSLSESIMSPQPSS